MATWQEMQERPNTWSQYLSGAGSAAPRTWGEYFSQQTGGSTRNPTVLSWTRSRTPVGGPFDQQYPNSLWTRTQNQQETLSALGVADSAIDTATGLFTGALDVIDRGRAASMGFATGLLNLAGRAGEAIGVSNPLDEWTAEAWNGQTGDDWQPDSFGGELANSPIGRAWRGLLGREDYGAGDFDGPLRMQDDDPLWVKALKGSGAFAIDVLADPLTYLTFGVGSIGKAAGSKVVYQGLKLAKDVVSGLSDDAVTELSERAVRTVRVGEQQTELAENTTRYTPRELAAQEFAGEAAEAFEKGGPRELRRWLSTQGYVPPDKADALWAALPDEVRGGLRFTLPFARDEYGVKRSIKLTGDAKPESVIPGVDTLADWANRSKLRVRTSRLGKGLVSRLGGRTGSIRAEMLEGLRDNAPSRTTYREMMEATELADEAAKVARDYSERIASTVAAVTALASGKNLDREEVYEQFMRFGNDPVLMREIQRDTLDEPARVGLEMAETVQRQINELYDEAREVGIEMNFINDYVPRVLTEELKAAKGAVTKANRGRGGSSYNPKKSREAYMTLVPDVGFAGGLRVKYLSPAEVNALNASKAAGGVADPVFEADPLVFYTAYARALSRTITEARFQRGLLQRGLAIDPVEKTIKAVNVADVPLAVQTARTSLSTAADEFDKVAAEARRDANFARQQMDLSVDAARQSMAGGADQTAMRSAADYGRAAERLEQAETLETLAASKAASAREWREALADEARQIANLSGDEQLEAVERLVALTGTRVGLLRSGSRRIPTEDNTLDEALEKTIESIGQTLRTRKVETTTGPDGFRRPGVTAKGKTDRNVVLPKKLADEQGGLIDDYWMSNGVASFVNDYFRRSQMESFKAYNEVYAPLYAIWKTWATVGRGPGYVLRNIVGAWWNNHLVGVTQASWRDSRRIIVARRTARRAVKQDAEAAGRELTDLELEDAVTARLADPNGPLARYKLHKDGTTLADAYRYMVDQRVFGDTRVRTDFFSSGQMVRGSDTIAVDLNVSQMVPYMDANLNVAQRGLNKAVDNPWIRMMGRQAQLSEEYVRGASFLHGVRKFGARGDDGFSANLMVKATQFDYTDLSPFERNVLKNIVPFYVWTRNNLPLQLRGLFTQPGKFNNLAKFQETIGDVLGGNPEDGEDGFYYDDYLPLWLRDKMAFTSVFSGPGGPIAIGLESSAVDLNTFIPFEFWSPSAWWEKSTKQGVGALNPFLKTGAGLAFGVDPSTGTRLNPDGALAPAWARALDSAGFGGLIGSRVDEDGNLRINAGMQRLVADLLPPIGQVERTVLPAVDAAVEGVTGYDPSLASERDEQRRLSNWGSFLGLPVATLTEEQVAGELRTRAEMRDRQILAELQAQGITAEWLEAAIENGYTPEQIQAAIRGE